MRIIIHIGSTKTGSSALQRFMYQNRFALSDSGIVYPEVGISNDAHHVLAALFHQNAYNMHKKEIDEREHDVVKNEYAKALSDIIKANPEKTMILSSEYLWNTHHKKEFFDFLNNCGATDISILCYLREVNDWLQSQYNQGVKNGRKLSFPQWFDNLKNEANPTFDYKYNLQEWEKVGVAKIEARVYSKNTLTEGLFADFLSSVNVDEAGFDLNKEGIVNGSPDTGSIDVIRILNGFTIPKSEKIALRQHLMNISNKRTLHEKLQIMDQETHHYIKENYRENIEFVERNYVVHEHHGEKLYEEIYEFRNADEKIEDITRAFLRIIIGILRT